jgi:glutamate 5-kinase
MSGLLAVGNARWPTRNLIATMSSPSRPDLIAAARLIVVKIGSRVLTTPDGLLDTDRIAKIGSQCDRLLEAGKQLVVVSSGAVAAGMGRLGLAQRPRSLPRLQAAAAVGQSCLIEAYERSLRPHGRHVAQVLLVAEDLQDRRRYLNIRGTLRALLDEGAVPIVNENDTVSVEELQTSFGDNDRLAALVATLLPADLLILLSDVAGLYDRPPETEGATVIPLVPLIDATTERLARDRVSGLSKGGMASKLAAARMATTSGCHCVIGPGKRDDVLEAICGGGDVGTLFPARQGTMPARKRWLGWSAPASGSLVVDAGARRAVVDGGSSLLAAGVLAVSGSFGPGDIVTLETPDEGIFARGLVNYAAADLDKIRGLQTEQVLKRLGRCGCDAVIHRDDLAVIQRDEPQLPGRTDPLSEATG